MVNFLFSFSLFSRKFIHTSQLTAYLVCTTIKFQ